MTKNKTRINNYFRTFKKMWGLKEKEKDVLKEALMRVVFWDSKENERIKEEDYQMYLDGASVTAIIPKRRFLKVIIDENFDVEPRTREYTKTSLSEINLLYSFSKEMKKKEIKSSYSTELIRIILNLIKYNNVISLKMTKDSPLWAETEDFIFIVAPRVMIEGEG